MRNEDVLITEYRVTVLGKSGQYVFDWVNQDANTVEFLKSESDFDDYPDEVKEILQSNGVSIVEPEESSRSTGREPNSNASPDPIDGSNTSVMDSSDLNNSSDLANPEDTKMESNPDTNIEDNEFKPTDGEPNPSPIGSEETTEHEGQHKSDKLQKSKSNGTSETHSFIVRMSDPSERRQIINKIKPEHSSAADQLELSGPFRVTYKIMSDGIELVQVEDLGIGSSVEQE